MKTQKSRSHATTLLFVIYLIFLTWVILFKTSFSFAELGYIRQVNLVPFWNDGHSNARIVAREIRDNALIFVPVGFYLFLIGEKRLLVCAGISLGISAIFEVLQYTFAIGVSDITDLITNTIGGIVGFGIAYLLLRNNHNPKKVQRITIIAGILTGLLLIGCVSIMILSKYD